MIKPLDYTPAQTFNDKLYALQIKKLKLKTFHSQGTIRTISLYSIVKNNKIVKSKDVNMKSITY